MGGNASARAWPGRLIHLSVLGICLAVSRSFCLLAQAPPPQSVVLISIDTLRADHLSCYGYKALETPHLDALTHGGTLFSQVSSRMEGSTS